MNNVRVKFNGKLGTVIGNQYRHYNEGNFNDRYVDVIFDGDKKIVPVLTEKLEVI